MAKSKVTFSSGGRNFRSAKDMLTHAFSKKAVSLVEDRLRAAGLWNEFTESGGRIEFNEMTSNVDFYNVSDEMDQKIRAFLSENK